MNPDIPNWAARLVRLGRGRTSLLLTAFAVLLSVLIVAIFTVIFDAVREDWPQYYIPAVVVPLLVAPIINRLLIDLVFALDAAHTQAATQQRELERVQRMDLVGRLASGLAHELNNLLTVVRASAHALGETNANADLAAIDDAAQRGARLTRRLLAISRHDEIARTWQRLPPVLEDLQRVVSRLLPPTVQLVLPTDVPDLHLELDADAVQHALLNLILNARDAMPQAGRVTVMVHTEGNGWLVLTVQDNGNGMSDELLARATEPFVTTKAAHEGTGLGLTIVRRTMELHGGRLTLTSAVGQGTTAALWFPIPAQPSAAEVVARSDAAARGTRTPPTATGGDRRVLVVDDELQVRQVTTRVLERAGFRVASVANAAAAWQWLAEQAPVDVVITDVMMPETTGLELLQQMRSSGDHTPVLLVSGFSVERVEEIIAADHTVRFLAKPWTPDVLTTVTATLATGAPGR